MRKGVRAALIVVLLFAGAGCAGLLALAAMFLAFVTSLEESSNPPPLPGRRTVVLVAIDDLRSDHLRPFGYRFDPAPALTALAEDGAAADGYRSASAATSASLASLLTGLAPAEHGLLSARELGCHRLAASVETLPEALATQGWRTLGSVSLRQLQGRYAGLDQGFEAWHATAPAGGGPLPAAQVVAAVEPELLEALQGDADVFLFLHFGDLREEGAGTAFLERHLAPFRAGEPAIGAALERAAVDPAGALADLELLLGRRRGDPALQALRAARYDARLAEVDGALQSLLERLRGAGFGRAEPLVVVAGTRGRVLAGGLDGAADAGAGDLLGTALVAGGPGVGAAWRRATMPMELMGLLRSDLSLGEAPRPPGFAAGGAVGWRLELAAPAGTSARVRLGSPQGEIAGLAGGAEAVRSPAGTSAEALLSAPGALAVECARRTAPLALVATGLGRCSAVLVAGADGARTLLPFFPPAAEAEAEGAAPRVVVERDGSWARVSAPGACAESRVALALWAYPPEPFGAALVLTLEPGADKGRSFPGLDAALVEGRGPLAARLRLRAGQRLAVAATIDGLAVAPAETISDEGGPRGDLSLYLPPAGVAALPASIPEAGSGAEPPELRATRLYPGPPMEPTYDLDDDDVRFLQRLGPLE